MKEELNKALIFLLFFTLITSAPLLSYDPTTGSATVTLLSKNENSFKWLYKTIAAGTHSIASVSLDMQSSNPTNKVSVVSYSNAAADFTFKAVSPSYSCALIAQGTTKLSLVKFTANDLLQEDLIASGFIASGTQAAGVAKTYQVSDLCTAFCVDGGATYRYNANLAGSTKFQADTVTSWAFPAFTKDFEFAVASDGLYRYTPKSISAPGSYSKVLNTLFYPNKKIWSTAIGVVVLSWESTGAGNIKNYKVQAIAQPLGGETVYTQIGTIEGQFFHPNAGSPPNIAISDLLDVVCVYGKTSASTFFAKGAKFHFGMKNAVNINFPTWVTQNQVQISVSMNYIYIRNSVNHGAFSVDVFGSGLYLAPIALTNPEKINNYGRSLLEEYPSGELYVLRQHNSLANGLGVLTLEPSVYPPTSQFFKWDRKAGISTAEYEGTGTYYAEVDGKPVWFAETIRSSTAKAFYSVTIDPVTSQKWAATLVTNQLHSLKSVSKNLRCAVIYDSSAGGTLKIYEFRPVSADVAVSTFRTVAAALYTGITLTDSLTTFEVADNCNAVRIKNVLIHWNPTLNSNAGAYQADIVPSGMNLVNPVSSHDLSIIVAQNGIYSYTSSNKTYSLARTQTYHASKQVYRVNKNLLILTWEPQATSNNYNFKLQFNSIQSEDSLTIVKFDQVSSQSYIFPWMSVSNRMTKVILGAIDKNNDTKMNYYGKNVNWAGKTTRDLNLTSDITSGLNMLAISEDFLYARNFQTETPKHLGYAIVGSNLVEAFNQNAQVSSDGYSRSFLIQDSANPGKMVLVHQYTNKQFIRLLKDVKKSSQQILAPNKVPPFDMTFNYGPNTINRMRAPAFGRWIWSQASGSTVKWVQYDPSVNEKKKTITQTSLTSGSSIVAVSRSFDCAVSLLTSATTFDTIKFDNSNAGSASKVSHWATVVADTTAAAINNAASNSIKAGDACWAFRINNLVYVRPSNGGAYVKSAVSASQLSTAIFDDSLKFAIVPSNGKLYKHDGSEFVNIFNVTGLMTTVQIYTSPDLNRVLIFSFNNSARGQSVAYATAIRLLVSNGTHYNPFTFPNNGEFTTRITEARMFFDMTFDTIVVGFASGTNTNQSVSINVANLNYETRTIANYQVPSVWYTWNEPNFFIFGNLIYCMQPKSPGSSDGVQYFFRLDKANLKIVQLIRRPVNPQEFSTFRGGKVAEENDLIYVLYESEPLGTTVGTVRIIRRGIGSQTLQNKIRDIVPQDAGFLIQNGQIRLCSPGCSFCINPTSCSECSKGYAMNTAISTCIRCAPLCQTCAQTDPTVCLTCIPGFYLQTSGGVSICKRCHDSCVTCNGASASACTSCKIGFYIQLNSCTQCIANCISCTASAANACDTCKPGYVYHSTSRKCVKCIAGCTVCNPAQIYSCVQCGVGFQSVLNAQNVITQCKVCPPRCRNCTNGNCLECRNGFRLVNNNCTEQCRLPCKQCTDQKADNCTSCLSGYTLSGGVCQPDLSCNSNKSCTSCPIGFNLVAGQCRKCNGGPNCRTCDNIDVDKCASCNRGFYLTETLTCARCNMTGCAACSSPVYCSQCRAGFILAGTGQSAKCTKCADRCATCFESPNNCDLCAPGFTKKGWGCISNINIKLKIVLNGNFSALTTEQYEGIEQAISTLLGKDRSQITVNQLRQGSILMDSTINSDNSAQQATMMDLLQTSLSNGAQIGGFTIQSTGIQGNSDVIAQDNEEAIKYRNIAIIVGVVIPIGMIIIFVVLIVLYKKGMIFNSSNATRIKDGSIDQIQMKNVQSLEQTKVVEIRS